MVWGSLELDFQNLCSSMIAQRYAAVPHSTHSTLDNPVFAVMELHRFDAYIDGDASGSEDADVHNEGPDVFFYADDLQTPQLQTGVAFPSSLSTSRRGDWAARRGYSGSQENYGAYDEQYNDY